MAQIRNEKRFDLAYALSSQTQQLGNETFSEWATAQLTEAKKLLVPLTASNVETLLETAQTQGLDAFLAVYVPIITPFPQHYLTLHSVMSRGWRLLLPISSLYFR